MKGVSSIQQLERRHARRQAKKDERFAVPVRVVRELSREELRRQRDREYLESMFPDLKGGL
jgi:hypothetical protein